MSNAVTNLDEQYPDNTDLELQVRSVSKKSDGNILMIIYAWLSEARKWQNKTGKAWGWQYCPFTDGEKVVKTYRGLKLKGKVRVCKDYYDGDCLVLYITLDKLSAKRWLAKTEATDK